MHPVLFKFGFIQIYSYGVMFTVGYFFSVYLISRRIGIMGLSKEFIWDFSLLILLCGVFGARLFYILLNLKFFLNNPQELFMIWHGGLVWFGGLTGAILSAAVFLKIKKVPMLPILDLFSPYIALAHGIGRIGCFLNGCCYGGFKFLPAQILSSILLIMMFVALRAIQKRPHKEGFVFSLYLLLYSAKRFFMEFIRNDSGRDYFGLTIFQVISLAVFLSIICIWTINLLLAKKKRGNA